jgi:hypothetical protein
MMRTADRHLHPAAAGARRDEAAVAGRTDEMKRNPDVVALAARLGLRNLTYRTFARPPMPQRPAAPEPAPPVVEAEPVATPALDELPPRAAAAAPGPVFHAAPAAPYQPPAAPMPAVAAAPPVVFPLLVQALARPGAGAPDAAGAAAAQPYLNLRHAVQGAAGQAEP